MAYGLTQSLDLERGSTQYATRADTASISITGSLAIEGWVKLESQPPTNGSFTFICKWRDASNGKSYLFTYADVAGVNYLRGFISSDGVNSGLVQIAHTLSLDTWTHIAMVYTSGGSGAVEIFVNGSSIGSGNSGHASIFDNNAQLIMGAFEGSNSAPYADHMDGKMSLWRLWAEARSGANISANICNVLGATTNLAAEWTLDNTYNDNSGNSNTLTAAGSPVFSTDVPALCAPVNTTNFFVMA